MNRRQVSSAGVPPTAREAAWVLARVGRIPAPGRRTMGFRSGRQGSDQAVRAAAQQRSVGAWRCL